MYHLEKIVRELSGNSDFALPYWGYISLNDTELPEEALLIAPEEFRKQKIKACLYFNGIKFCSQSADELNSLYESSRYTPLQEGAPIDATFAKTRLLDPMEGLRRTKDYQSFNSGLDDGPHGSDAQLHRWRSWHSRVTF